MADTKISDLVDGGAPVSGDSFVVARSGGDNKIDGLQIPGAEWDYVEKAAGTVNFSASSDATAVAYITGNAKTFDGSTRIIVEFYSPLIDSSSSAAFLNLYDGSTDLGRLGAWANAGAHTEGPVHVARFVTPSAGSHTFSIRAWQTGTSGFIVSGAGGSGGNYMPAWYRITKA